MMEQLFARYLEAGIFGSVVIVIVLLLRLCLRKAPRRILCLLWLLAAIRLMLPFQLESRISLQPDLDEVAVAVQQMQQLPQTQLPPVDVPVNQPIELPIRDPVQIPVTTPTPDLPVQQIAESVDPMVVLSIVWLSAAGAAILYMAVSYCLLKFRVREAVRNEDGIMECDRIRGAFLLGYIHPRIYLPFRVQKRDRRFIVAHERAHVARGDNWWKLLGFVCAALHWYNPLVWLSYVLLCRDIELACDERVIRELDINDRKAYSMALLNCGKSLAGVSVCPVAFGEVSLKTRIKRVLHYRKPGVWITVIAMMLIVVTAVCFLTSPSAEALPPEQPPETTEPTTEETEPSTEPTIEPTEPETVPEPTEHVHAYTIQTVAPTCTEEGYDLHLCTCGDQFTDNPVEPTGHKYVQMYPDEDNAERTFEDTYYWYCCELCDDKCSDIVKGKKDPETLVASLISYAASFGFDMNFTGSKSDAKRFASRGVNVLDSGAYEITHSQGQSLIQDAYQYCVDNDLDVTKQMCLIVGDFPRYDVIDPSKNLPSGRWLEYHVYVYILARLQESELEHVHAYVIQTIPPTCTEGGYDLHTCPCGDTFQDNATEPTGHYWVQNPKYANDKYSTAHARICTICNEETWYVENANVYPDFNFDGIRDMVLSYARSLGFKTVTSGNLGDTFSYSTTIETGSMLSTPGYDWEEYMTDRALALVDRAYLYCIENSLPVSEQTVLLTSNYQSMVQWGWTAQEYICFDLYCTQNKSE